MDWKILSDIGLTKNEVTVYTTLLKLGSVKVGFLLKEVSLHRSRVYEALHRLIEKGLCSSVIRSNVKYFEAADPQRLLSYIEEQKEILAEKEKNLKEIIPNLQNQISSLSPHAEAHVFSGKEGFKTVRKDVLKQKKTLYLLGAVGKEDKALRYFFPTFDKLRLQSRIKIKVLYDHEVKGKPIANLDLMDSRFLPREYSSPAVINIYGDRVVTVLWKDDNPLCFMIINKDIADSYRKWFHFLWKKTG